MQTRLIVTCIRTLPVLLLLCTWNLVCLPIGLTVRFLALPIYQCSLFAFDVAYLKQSG